MNNMLKISPYNNIILGEAIQKLRETEEMLNKKQDFLEKKIESKLLFFFIYIIYFINSYILKILNDEK